MQSRVNAREHQITYFHDGPDPIVTAPNYGGAKHPQWYYNIKAHPECELGGEKFLATEITDPDDYERVYGLAEQVYAGWSDYRLKTTRFVDASPSFGSSRASGGVDCDTRAGPTRRRRGATPI